VPSSRRRSSGPLPWRSAVPGCVATCLAGASRAEQTSSVFRQAHSLRTQQRAWPQPVPRAFPLRRSTKREFRPTAK
jgi:hypothetical protein